PASSQTGGLRSGAVMTLTEADAHAIPAECPSVLAVSPFIGTSGQVIGGNVNWKPAQALGVGPDYVIVGNSPMAAGEVFTEREIRALLTERHRLPAGEPPDFEVRNTADVANVFAAIMGTLTAMLSAIAAISLVVGGVGIMNIMLVSVTERTREIGIRMALGARPRDILRQFLVEAVVLSSIGGAFGVAFGIGSSYGAAALI